MNIDPIWANGMKFFKKRRLQKKLFGFWKAYMYDQQSPAKKLNDGLIGQLVDILNNKDVPLSEIDFDTCLWDPLLNTVAEHSFSEKSLSLLAVTLQQGLPVSERAVLHVANKLDHYTQVTYLGSEDQYLAPMTRETNYRNSAGLKKFLELLSAFDAPWATTTYRRPGYDDCTVAQYLATKQIDSQWAVEDGRFVPGVNLSVFTSFFQKYAADQPINSLSVDSILEKRQEERFANTPDTIIVTEEGQPANIQPAAPQSMKLHF